MNKRNKNIRITTEMYTTNHYRVMIINNKKNLIETINMMIEKIKEIKVIKNKDIKKIKTKHKEIITNLKNSRLIIVKEEVIKVRVRVEILKLE